MKSVEKKKPFFNTWINTWEFSSIRFLLKQDNKENTKQHISPEITLSISIKLLSETVLVFLSLLKSRQGELLAPF